METVNLMYHDIYISDPLESGFIRERDMPYKLQLASFRNQVKNISEYCLRNNLSKDSVVFTFDDGGCSFYNMIADILEEFGYKGKFYVSTQYVGSRGFLSADEIRALDRRGHVIGSHAHSHEHLYKLTAEQVKKEWELSQEILSDILGHSVHEASIPNGDASEMVISYAYDSGIREIYTSMPTTTVYSYRDAKVYGRYVVISGTSLESVISIIGSKFTRRKILFKWKIIYYIKLILGDKYISLKNLLYRN